MVSLFRNIIVYSRTEINIPMDHTSSTPQQLGPLLLEMGMMMLKSGASSHRIGIVLNRVTAAYKCIAHIDIQPKAISLSLEKKDEPRYNAMRRTANYGVNFTVLSGISLMSWRIAEKRMSTEDVRAELDRLNAIPHYSRWLILVMVALAGAGFCYTFGGSVYEMGVSFLATFCGLFAKQELLKRSVNQYVCTFLSAATAALVTGAFFYFGLELSMEHAYATCVLFLIPGVHLINFFIDLIAGNILYGIERGANALMHTLAIALGLVTAVSIYQF